MTTKRKAGRLSRAIMDKKEWDFAQIPASELQACFCYEYGRQLTRQWPILQKSILLVKTGSVSERKHRNATYAEPLKPIRHILSARFGAFPTELSDYFPDTSWNNIDIKLRSKAAEDVRKDLKHYEQGGQQSCIFIRMLRKSESLDMSFLRNAAYKYDSFSLEALDQTAYAGIAINLSYSDAEIAKAFKLSLKSVRQEHEALRSPIINRAFSRIMASGTKPPALLMHRRKGRGGYRDKLRWLGALRVVRYYPPSQLANYPHTNIQVDAPYSHLPDLYEAAKRAQGLLTEIREPLCDQQA
jgi:hypothetical protein